MKTKLPLPDNKTICDICNATFAVNKNSVREERLTLEKGDFLHEVVLTYLYCPNCGKRYPVIMDDETTLSVLEELQGVMLRRVKCAKKGMPIPQKLNDKYKRLNRKLDFRRNKLAEKFDGSFYQTAEGKERLDYRYHAR